MRRVNPFATIASFPSNVCVDGQNPNEYVLLFVREHKVILLINLILYTFILFLPQILKSLLTYLDINIFGSFIGINNFFNTNWWTIINIGWLAYVLTGYFNIFFKWFYNINILTNERFVDIDFEGIFDNRIESAMVKDIEDAKDTQSGLLQTIFDMGDISILTASGGTVFSLSNVPKSYKVRDFIMDVKLKLSKGKGGDDD